MVSYLMEDPIEAERLEIKTKRTKILRELKCMPLEAGQRVLDVGCGTGAVSRLLAEKVFPGSIVGLDFSPHRLATAMRLKEEEGVENLSFVCSDLFAPGMKNESFDLVYSRCLFQYLRREQGVEALRRMRSLVRPGGRVVVADVDGVCLYRWPPDPEREEAMELLLKDVESTGFDAFMGRKLYGMFIETGFENVTVDLLPYYLIAGPADSTTVRVWEMKAEILKERFTQIFGSREKAKDLLGRFMEDFHKRDVLLYNLIFIVQGTS
jgi:ubiquinone/menaquinone biosynthesis C-methylase UbiE